MAQLNKAIVIDSGSGSDNTDNDDNDDKESVVVISSGPEGSPMKTFTPTKR